MKEFFISGVLFLSVLAIIGSPSPKVVRLEATAPDDSVFYGFLYEDGTFAGRGMIKDAEGKPVKVQVWDMSFAPDEQLITICPGVDEDNSFCVAFNYEEGTSMQGVDWVSGPAEFKVQIHTYTR